MKHWHRCQRWTRRAMSCPFIGAEDHEDTEDADEFLDFTTVRKPAKAKVPPLEAKAEVGVREPRRALPTALARAAAVPIQQPGFPIPDIVGPPIPAPGKVEPGRVALPAKAEAVTQVMRAAEQSVGRVPQKAKFSREDFAFLFQSQVAAGSVDVASQNRLAGQARVDAIQTQMAEEAVAEAFAPAQSTQIEVLRELVHRPPAGLVAIPLLAEAFRLLRRSAMFRSAVPISPGRIGTAGAVVPADLAARSTPLTVKTLSRAPSGPGTMAEARPARRFSGGMLFNAAERMRQMMGVSRRMVNEL